MLLTVVFSRITGIQSFRSTSVFAVVVNEHVVRDGQQRSFYSYLRGNDHLLRNVEIRRCKISLTKFRKILVA